MRACQVKTNLPQVTSRKRISPKLQKQKYFWTVQFISTSIWRLFSRTTTINCQDLQQEGSTSSSATTGSLESIQKWNRSQQCFQSHILVFGNVSRGLHTLEEWYALMRQEEASIWLLVVHHVLLGLSAFCSWVLQSNNVPAAGGVLLQVVLTLVVVVLVVP